jgi:HK97 family phage major capsid protein
VSSALETIKGATTRRKDIQGELRSIDEAADADKRVYTEDEAAKIAELRSQLEQVDSRVMTALEIEMRSADISSGMEHLAGAMLDSQSGEVVDTRSIGARFAHADGYAEWAQNARGQFTLDLPDLDMRAVTDVTTGATSAGAFIVPTMLPRVGMDFLNRRVWFSDLIPHIPVPSGSVEYVQDTSPLADLADKAIEVTEGSAKPQAGPTFSLITEPIATVAAWANITRQAAADAPQVQGYLDTRIRYSLRRRVDGQSINGNGTPPNLKGLANRTGILTNAPGSAEARAITIRHSITLMEAQDSVPEIIVLNPADAEIFDLTNATSAGLHAVVDNVTTGEGAYAGAPSRSAWGLTQVHSNAIASGTALLVDPTAVAYLDRMQPTAFMTDSHASNFISNILTLLLELRVGLALFNPKGVLKATFNGTT